MAGKLPIPRLRCERRVEISRRTGRACETCRERKSKCDGAMPTCTQCLAHGFENCFYSERKAIRQQRLIDSMRSEIGYYQKLLREISQEVSGQIAVRVSEALSRFDRNENLRCDGEPSGSSSSLISLEKCEVANEEFNRNEASRATGFVGNSSEVAWMQHLNLQSIKQKDGKSAVPISSLNYHLDQQAMIRTRVANVSALPLKPLADKLLQIYLQSVHGSLPIIRKDLFTAQYQRCYSRKGITPGNKWLAILNMIFAIACAFNRLSGQEMPPGADESVFAARAKSLSISENVLYDHSDLQQVQAETLMALLLLVQSQINRSWKMIGIATRSGISLGLNIDKKIIGLDVKSVEARNQLWWTIFRLESLLSVMTGRYSCLENAASSASPRFLHPNLDFAAPDILHTNELQWTVNLREEQKISQISFLRSVNATQSLYFFYMADLALISHGIINEVYATKTLRRGPSYLENRIAFYRAKLDYWASSLHPVFCFKGDHIDLSARESPSRSSLALSYYSTEILLNRPLLGILSFEEQSNISHYYGTRFAYKAALNCLQSSLAVIAQLPDQPNLAWCYHVSQWWNILHILTQATVILLLNISLLSTPIRSEEFPFPIELDVWVGVTKALGWLHCISKTSESAHRAFHFFNTCAQRIAADSMVNLDYVFAAIDQFRIPGWEKMSEC